MSYQVLARKWRPRSFTQVVGQEHVLPALINALDHNRLHHAFLFTGTRGVGKTTLARLLAKSLNCQKGVTSTPCGNCQNCRAIETGSFLDLIEVDAASRTGVDDTRELLDNAHYAPNCGRYKVYLIDEVHMFSTSSFNALLKTLEEPPPHVKFLLATTDPKKIPVTVLSRCLQFNLRRIAPQAIARHLKNVLMEEQIPSESEALNLIARLAGGSVRDALSLLDQAISYGEGHVTTAGVRAMLGSIEQQNLWDLLEALLSGNGEQLIEKAREICDYVVDTAALLADFLHLLQRLAFFQMAPNTVDDINEQETLRHFSQRMSPEDIQLFYQIGLMGSRDLAYALEPREVFEMVLLRMLCFQPTGYTSGIQSLAGATTRPNPPSPPPRLEPSPTQEKRGEDWPYLVTQLNLTAISRQFAENCALERREGDTFYLQLASNMANLHNQRTEDRLRQAMEEYYGHPVRLSIRIGEIKPHGDTVATRREKEQEMNRQAAVKSIQNDVNIKAFCETFNTQLPLDSVHPLAESEQKKHPRENRGK